MDGRLRKGLLHRLAVYLKSVKSTETPLTYVQLTIQ